MLAHNRSRTHFVEASCPKKSARMPLSIPTTSMPSDAKYVTASDPTSPAEPVIIATLTIQLLRTHNQIHSLAYLPRQFWSVNTLLKPGSVSAYDPPRLRFLFSYFPKESPTGLISRIVLAA